MANNFTPEQIEQFLQEFFTVVGRRQYIGARYVPIFGRKDESSIEWDNTKPYEPLTIVTYQGNSYTSRTYVPAGIAITDTSYWANTGNYNAQVELYRAETAVVKAQADATDALIPKASFDSVNTVKKYIDDNDNVKVFYFDNVSNMKVCAFLYAGAICKTAGFYESGDGGDAWYEIVDTGIANERNIIECGNLFAKLLPDDFISVEMLGFKKTDDLSEAINSCLSLGFKYIQLQAGVYNLESEIKINNVNFGCLVGVCSCNSEASYLSDYEDATVIMCNHMNGEIGISIEGCFNFCIGNFYLTGVDNDNTPDVGIYYGRLSNHLSSMWNNISGVCVYLPSKLSVNNGNGTIAFYNCGAEQIIVRDCSFQGDTGIVNTAKDCLDIASAFNKYIYSNATCSSLVYENITINASIMCVFGYTNSVHMRDLFGWDPYKNRPNSIVLDFQHKNEPSNVSKDLTFSMALEQVKDVIFIRGNSTDGRALGLQFSDITINFSGVNYDSNGVLQLASGYSLIGTRFNFITPLIYSETIADISNVTGTISACKFDGSKIKTRYATYGTFGFANQLGMFGPSSSTNVYMAFAINENIVLSGGYPTPPAVSDVGNGSIYLNANPSNKMVLWQNLNSTWEPIIARYIATSESALASIAPDCIGQLALDGNQDKMFIAIGTNAGDWKAITS